MSKVWDAFPGSGSDLIAMLALADWSDDEGRCFPSMSAIASKTRLSRSQAQRVVHGLVDGGYIQVVGNEFGGAPGATRQYRIVLSSMTGRMDAQRRAAPMRPKPSVNRQQPSRDRSKLRNPRVRERKTPGQP